MKYVFVIIIFNLFHQQQAILPGTYQDIGACHAVALQTHVTFGNYASCEYMGIVAAQRLQRHTQP